MSARRWDDLTYPGHECREDPGHVSEPKTSPDSRFFEECREIGALDTNTELIAKAFKVEWVAAEVAEMSRRVEGDVKMAEVVERTKVRLIRKFREQG